MGSAEDEKDTPLYDSGTASEQEESRYRKLWRAVLLTALGDATGRGRMLGVHRSGRKRATWRARKWLTTDTADIRAACDLAGFDATILLQYARRLYGTY